MLPEVGHFSLIIGLCLALLLATLPMAGAVTGNLLLVRTARSLAVGQFVFVAIGFVVLATVFYNDDFSVAVVANNSNSLLPPWYKISAVWGNHEGSLLLWALILAGWTVAVALFSRSLPEDMVARVLSVMGMVAVGFLLFSLATSNPFERALPMPPEDGRDLNPLLQDVGLILHPPMLYFGYVGFSVAFAFAIAALSSGRLDTAWARWSRPWTLAAWMFLTLGIALGSWWAYYELGWGGWWFWDPVENASFMPWIAGTALIHSLAVTEKRGMFKSWTVLLAICTFSLSLLGTFLVRSGVLTSVHSFAADPARGLFILIFLGIVVGGSFTLYALRAPSVRSEAEFSLLSRETLLMVNNVVLMVAMLTVLIGTLYPLILAALDMGKISVGPPYFNATFVPLTAVLMVAMGVGPLLKWRASNAAQIKKILFSPVVVSLVCGLAFPWLYGGSFDLAVFITITLAVWLTASMLIALRQRLAVGAGGLVSLGGSFWGMFLGHIGLAVCAVGVGLTTAYSTEMDLRMDPGDTISVAGYEFRFFGSSAVEGPNYVAEQGLIVASKGGSEYRLRPEKRHYSVQSSMMTEAAINPGLFRDLYVAMGEPLEKGAWAIRIHYKPFVRWLWLGGLIMALGGICSMADKRYRRARQLAPQTVKARVTGREAANGAS
jgi:cytochrome c-type biogenesis protein CcmF